MEIISVLSKPVQDLLKEELDRGSIFIFDNQPYKRGDTGRCEKYKIEFDLSDYPFFMPYLGGKKRRVPVDWAVFLSENDVPGRDYVLGRKNGNPRDLRTKNIKAFKAWLDRIPPREHYNNMISRVRDMIVDDEDISNERLSHHFQISTNEARILRAKAKRWAENRII